MPPVAEDFIGVCKRLIGEGNPAGVRSWRSLYKRLAEVTGLTEDGWKRNFGRYREGETNPTEQTIARTARAFEVPRETFPPAVRKDRLRELQDALDESVRVQTDQEARLVDVERRLLQVEGRLETLEVASTTLRGQS